MRVLCKRHTASRPASGQLGYTFLNGSSALLFSVSLIYKPTRYARSVGDEGLCFGVVFISLVISDQFMHLFLVMCS